ncbi:MAG: bifunctional hydroxymethylpyrimidine kinase/phosphomethylpyrimidine kinase [Candidatus Thermoplasmatota archaeon]|nr:bifunctional hydroxymethylpyrimidine kinase/phosphomethylpyrimidine kinase [Candidatus Thermoplasmatota archaeon]
MQKVVLTIGGSDSSGGAGIQADLKAFSVAGVYGTSVITCITSQNTMEVKSIYPLPTEVIKSQIDVILDDFEIGAAKTGMLYMPEIAKIVAEKMEGIRLVVDPVLISTTGSTLSSPNLVEAIKKYLIPSCCLITPNVEEAEKICGIKIEGIEDARKACGIIHGLGAENVVIKGGHMKGDASDILFDGNEFYTFTLPRISKKAHGSGCIFSAFITAFLAEGQKLAEGVENAKKYAWSAICAGFSPGKGVDIVRQRANHIPVIDGKKTEVWLSLQDAVDELLSFLPVSLIPEVGINFVYAMADASSYGDICGIDGRIVRAKKPFQAGECRFGTSKHISSVLLACMRNNGAKR